MKYVCGVWRVASALNGASETGLILVIHVIISIIIIIITTTIISIIINLIML